MTEYSIDHAILLIAALIIAWVFGGQWLATVNG